ncbi:MAG: DUF3108 domain-containing protein [Rhizobiaceae bacterium]|nr:DUF3108 domain-containing protein [Rhizobiaceae bacterium]
MTLRSAFISLATAAATLTGVSGAAQADSPVKFSAEYVVTLRGITVAKAGFSGAVTGQRYEVEGQLASAGIGKVLGKTEASARSAGTFNQPTPTPESFMLSFAQGGHTSKTELIFKNGNAVSTSFQPDWKAGSDTIPITPNDLQSVADPVAATVVARGTPDQICGRTLRVFEGGTRIDVELKLASVGFIEGIGNNAVTCRANFVPVAGMTANNGTYDYLRKKADMELIYVPAARGGLYLLHTMSARTDIGRVQLRAYRRNVRG